LFLAVCHALAARPVTARSQDTEGGERIPPVGFSRYEVSPAPGTIWRARRRLGQSPTAAKHAGLGRWLTAVVGWGSAGHRGL